MPLPQDKIKNTKYKPSKEVSKLVLDVMARIKDLKTHRSGLMANPYDQSPDARSIEDIWDFADFVSLPHKFYNTEMQSWMANNSHPLILAKIDTAVSIIAAKNPEVELVARSEKFETKTAILEALYGLGWDKGQGRQQLIKFINTVAKYGSAFGREYHRYRKRTVPKIISYDPDLGQHITETKELIDNDEAYFETLPIRDVWIDNRAKPYDESSIRDCAWTKCYDYSTLLLEFPKEKYPNVTALIPTDGNNDSDYASDKADIANDIPGNKVRLWFYEDEESNKKVVTDGLVLLSDEILLNNKLSLVTAMWKMRNEHTIYGLGLPEILENSDEMLNRVVNMTQNQIILSISGAGFYGGSGNVTDSDMILEPKLKKLRDSDKINFPKIPGPDSMVLELIQYIEDRADEYSGVTKALGGEQVGKTLGEAVLNREAGLRRLQTPLQNIEFALERQGRLRIDLIQLIYGRPQKTEMIVNEFGAVIDPKLHEEFMAAKESLGEDNIEFAQKFPQMENGEVYRNQFRKERLGVKKDEKGEYENDKSDKLMEILPVEVEGEYDVRVRAFSTIPVSQSLTEARTAETYGLIAKSPYVDAFKADTRLLKSRKEKPEDWLKTEDDIMQEQEEAQQVAGQEGEMEQGQMEQEQAQLGTQDEMDQTKIAEMQANMEQMQPRGPQTEPGVQSPATQL